MHSCMQKVHFLKTYNNSEDAYLEADDQFDLRCCNMNTECETRLSDMSYWKDSIKI